VDSWLVTIAGGSGSGKSTLALGLYKKYPELITIIGLDDYYKSAEEAPKRDRMTDWETPSALRFDDLVQDIKTLLSGKPIMVRSKHELYNPDYQPELRNKIEVELVPRRVLLLEGYLALYDARIRSLTAFSVFLSMPIRQSVLRRSKNKAPQSEEYFKKMLFPAHEEIVLPTRNYADMELSTLERSPEEILSVVEGMLQVGKFLPK
jgi:uridine kinase